MTKVEYAKIRTMAELKAERRRIGREMEQAGERLRDDYRNVSRMFTLGYAVEYVAGRADRIYTLVQWGMSGFRFVRSMIDKYRSAGGTRGTKDSE